MTATATRLLPVVVALVLGLLGMHALVVGDAGMRDAPMSMDSIPAAAPSEPRSVDRAGEGPAAMPAVNASHGDHGPSTHPMLHLCLAVLAGLMVLLLGIALLRTEPAAVTTTAERGRGRREPPVRPPPTSVRLARLCVMRN
ncbi:DUF6153 family protein [Pseudonocardia endophytica]|uniref:Uncharacterized protein n=1 Tax=Pseudonocardia endophytica TaxID=401976 RepID=A0A4V2PHP0_PSEEN|nr:DUF6153 family protein [Pseudonocardia endophytica]TCK21456.1 hypothetical protein EV378_5442 [Pseudonocardia endophytica]